MLLVSSSFMGRRVPTYIYRNLEINELNCSCFMYLKHEAISWERFIPCMNIQCLLKILEEHFHIKIRTPAFNHLIHFGLSSPACWIKTGKRGKKWKIAEKTQDIITRTQPEKILYNMYCVKESGKTSFQVVLNWIRLE